MCLPQDLQISMRLNKEKITNVNEKKDDLNNSNINNKDLSSLWTMK
jgi:hypothetical protein